MNKITYNGEEFKIGITGLGDLIAKLIWFILKIKPCRACNYRRYLLNKWIPFKKDKIYYIWQLTLLSDEYNDNIDKQYPAACLEIKGDPHEIYS